MKVKEKTIVETNFLTSHAFAAEVNECNDRLVMKKSCSFIFGRTKTVLGLLTIFKYKTSALTIEKCSFYFLVSSDIPNNRKCNDDSAIHCVHEHLQIRIQFEFGD